MPNRLRISLVIPVYNEESHIADCLAAALEQQVPFFEIIVVDNNSTDGTAGIARAFPGVKVLKEAKQGVVHGRNRGLNAAKGDILARIDADTRLPIDWTQQLETVFKSRDCVAVSGSLHYYDVGMSEIVDGVDLRIRSWLSKKMSKRTFLLGANMALTQAAWQQIKPVLCDDKGLHEDLDLAVHLGDADMPIVFDARLLAGVSGRRADTNLMSFLRYLKSLPLTYELHGRNESRYMYPVMAMVLAFYLPLRVLYRCYDIETDKFRVSRLFGIHDPERVNPVTFVD